MQNIAMKTKAASRASGQESLSTISIFSARYSAIVFLSVFVIGGQALWAADGSTGPGRFDYRQKAEKKEGSRWTLQEWLAQKEKNKMMDLWLAMYAPSPYEFYFSAQQVSYSLVSGNPETSQAHSAVQGSIGAFATVLGLEVQFENNVEEKYNDQTGLLQLRIAGNAVQGTHLILQYGLRTRNLTGATITRINSSFAGADLNLYFNRYVGISGLYRSFIPAENEVLGTVSGTRTEVGLFIDFAAVRIFGSSYSEKESQLLSGLESKSSKTGIVAGLKFFF